MLFTDSIKYTFKRSFDYKGRSNRQEFLFFLIFQAILSAFSFFCFFVFSFFGTDNIISFFSAYLLLIISSVITILPVTALFVRRIRDCEINSFFVAMLVISFFIFPLIFILFCGLYTAQNTSIKQK